MDKMGGGSHRLCGYYCLGPVICRWIISRKEFNTLFERKPARVGGGFLFIAPLLACGLWMECGEAYNRWPKIHTGTRR